jgi:2-C-methyl-D-erythritol 4-phosphate cytidylyltransferase
LKKYSIIVAGGSGTRMGTEIPKQFIEINGMPVIMHTINAFYNFDNNIEIIIVLPSKFIDYWKKLCVQYKFNIEHKIADGGPARFHSVKSGLNAIKDNNSIVAIHDSVRPLVSKKVIESAFYNAEIYGNAIPVIKINESIREKDGFINRPANRENFYIVQTPQCFKTEIIKKAYTQNYNDLFTDDASVIESIGETIHLIEGNPENIKITTPVDLIFAKAIISENEITSF